MTRAERKIVLPGGAGLVGQNLIVQLKRAGFGKLVVLDKHEDNLKILRKLHPDVTAIWADLAEPGKWEVHFENAGAVVMLQAQTGNLHPETVTRNHVISTKCVLQNIRKYNVPYMVHVNSSGAAPTADDDYSRSKREQEKLVTESGVRAVVLRPTPMFGWFDRRYLGWLPYFMKTVSVFPIPGNGRYVRQPLYVQDFCHIIVRCMETEIAGKTFNITGLERVNYIDVLQQIKRSSGAKCRIVPIPYSMFYLLLKAWPLFDQSPPYTINQLPGIVTNDEFEVIDWPGLFGVTATPFARALDETFNDPVYSKVILEL